MDIQEPRQKAFSPWAVNDPESGAGRGSGDRSACRGCSRGRAVRVHRIPGRQGGRCRVGGNLSQRP